jgi:hypothetical protein
MVARCGLTLELSGGVAVRLDDWLGPGDRPCGYEYRVVLLIVYAAGLLRS